MNEIYFDNAATTQTDIEIATLFSDIACNHFGNPSSLHSKGLEGQQLIQKAESQLLKALGAKVGKIIFTSGGTEANNLAIFGAVFAKKRYGNKIITTQVEHSSVMQAFDQLEQQGYQVIKIAPNQQGLIDVDAFLSACDEDTIFASCMGVNNETGGIMPVAQLSKELKKQFPKIVFHIDAVQALGKIPFNQSQIKADLITVSGHKINVPKGVGALYIAPKVRVLPQLFGGSQQGAVRPGTESVPMIVALGQGAQNATANFLENQQKATAVKNAVINLLKNIDNVSINSPENSSPYILNCSVLGYRSETLLHFLAAKGIFVSSGSACSKGAKSHVLFAMGKSNKEVDSALRISFSKYNTVEQAEIFCNALIEAKATLRSSN